MVSKLCPFSTIIDYTTSELKRVQSSLILQGRCIPCRTEHQFLRDVQALGLEKEDEQEVCAMQTCLRSSWHVTKFCEQHFKAWTPLAMLDEPKELALLQDHLQTAFSARWKPSCDMRMVLNLRASILADKIQSSRLRFLDLEYNPRTGRVLEVGMCDATGKKTIDCLTRLNAAELARTSLPIDKNTKRIEYLHKTAVKRHGSAKAL